MASVTIYTTMFCPYCLAAKRLLSRKDADFREIDVGRNPELRRAMQLRSGGRGTVPQIWIGDVHIGGCDELFALEDEGRLDALLAA